MASDTQLEAVLFKLSDEYTDGLIPVERIKQEVGEPSYSPTDKARHQAFMALLEKQGCHYDTSIRKYFDEDFRPVSRSKGKRMSVVRFLAEAQADNLNQEDTIKFLADMVMDRTQDMTSNREYRLLYILMQRMVERTGVPEYVLEAIHHIHKEMGVDFRVRQMMASGSLPKRFFAAVFRLETYRELFEKKGGGITADLLASVMAEVIFYNRRRGRSVTYWTLLDVMSDFGNYWLQFYEDMDEMSLAIALAKNDGNFLEKLNSRKLREDQLEEEVGKISPRDKTWEDNLRAALALLAKDAKLNDDSGYPIKSKSYLVSQDNGPVLWKDMVLLSKQCRFRSVPDLAQFLEDQMIDYMQRNIHTTEQRNNADAILNDMSRFVPHFRDYVGEYRSG